jgi:hypothetical protein
MLAPPGSLLDIPAAVSRYLDVAEYILFRLALFASFVLVLFRLIVKEWKRR